MHKTLIQWARFSERACECKDPHCELKQLASDMRELDTLLKKATNIMDDAVVYIPPAYDEPSHPQHGRPLYERFVIIKDELEAAREK